MDRDKILEKITNIGTCEDEATRRTLLAELNDGVNGVFNDYDTLLSQNEDLTRANETLRESNMQLFLKVGEKKKPEGAPEEPPAGAPKRNFEDLFNEKGMIK